jgi:membrane-associated phospholipid phosphatase
MADEIGISRLYAGIHYRFDIDTGLSLGHAAAQLALQLDRERGIANIVH